MTVTALTHTPRTSRLSGTSVPLPPAVVRRGIAFYNGDMRRPCIPGVVWTVLVALPASAQTPQPFPRGGATQTAPAPPPAPRPAVPAPTTGTVDPATPSEATLGFPVYPAAQFIASYDAGRAQRYYIFGTMASFVDLVTYYLAQLKDKGDLAFPDPPTHVFYMGGFKQATKILAPGRTIKDWTWGGAKGYT